MLCVFTPSLVIKWRMRYLFRGLYLNPEATNLEPTVLGGVVTTVNSYETAVLEFSTTSSKKQS